jgi:aspartate/methionine/tyrosine aminotransferase
MGSISLADSLSQVSPSKIRELADIAFAMDRVLKLQFGESDMPTPGYIKEAAYRAMQEGYTFYTENAGLPSLRSAIARKYEQLHGLGLDPASEILVTASGVQALNVSIRCVIDPGDEAIVLSPNWPNATAIVSMFCGKAVEVPFAVQEGRFTPDFTALEKAVTPRTRLLVYTSPSNPLGWVATTSEQKTLLDFCRSHSLWLLADEVYERIYYGSAEGGVTAGAPDRGEPATGSPLGAKAPGEVQTVGPPAAPSILRLCTRDEAVIVVNSFSKSYCMTGWRLGWVVSRGDLVRRATQLNEFIVSHAPAMVQRAGETALERGEESIQNMVSILSKRVAFCYEALASIGSVTVNRPEGAFYLFPRIAGLEDSFSFCVSILKEKKVAVAPGAAFGAGGEGAIRICCASDPSILEPAMERIRRFLEAY